MKFELWITWPARHIANNLTITPSIIQHQAMYNQQKMYPGGYQPGQPGYPAQYRPGTPQQPPGKDLLDRQKRESERLIQCQTDDWLTGRKISILYHSQTKSASSPHLIPPHIHSSDGIQSLLNFPPSPFGTLPLRPESLKSINPPESERSHLSRVPRKN